MREKGLYWVRLTPAREWTIGEFADGEWRIIGEEEIYKDRDFYKIEEQRIIHN
jgi:hypothetical protein